MRLSLVVEAGDSVRDGAGESVGIGEGLVSELMLLEVAPASFDSLPRTQGSRMNVGPVAD